MLMIFQPNYLQALPFADNAECRPALHRLEEPTVFPFHFYEYRKSTAEISMSPDHRSLTMPPVVCQLIVEMLDAGRRIHDREFKAWCLCSSDRDYISRIMLADIYSTDATVHIIANGELAAIPIDLLLGEGGSSTYLHSHPYLTDDVIVSVHLTIPSAEDFIFSIKNMNTMCYSIVLTPTDPFYPVKIISAASLNSDDLQSIEEQLRSAERSMYGELKELELVSFWDTRTPEQFNETYKTFWELFMANIWSVLQEAGVELYLVREVNANGTQGQILSSKRQFVL